MAIDDFVANAAVSIISNRQDVWNALVNPDAIRHYMFGAEVKSDWRVGSEISWKGKLNGTQYEDKGVILKIEPQKILKYSQFNSLSGQPDISDNYHFVTIYLSDGADKTEVSLTLDNNDDENARINAEKKWSVILNGLKGYVEKV